MDLDFNIIVVMILCNVHKLANKCISISISIIPLYHTKGLFYLRDPSQITGSGRTTRVLFTMKTRIWVI